MGMYEMVWFVVSIATGSRVMRRRVRRRRVMPMVMGALLVAAALSAGLLPVPIGLRRKGKRSGYIEQQGNEGHQGQGQEHASIAEHEARCGEYCAAGA